MVYFVLDELLWTFCKFNEPPYLIMLSVSDSGEGIPADKLQTIFDIADASKVYRFGLGLPLMKQIISEHMGDISVDSTPGKGTTFTATFPSRWIL